MRSTDGKLEEALRKRELERQLRAQGMTKRQAVREASRMKAEPDGLVARLVTRILGR